MFGTCHGEDAQHPTVFNRFIEKHSTAGSIMLCKSRLVEVRESGYTTLLNLANTTDAQLFCVINLPLDMVNRQEPEGMSQVAFFRAIVVTQNRKLAFEASSRY